MKKTYKTPTMKVVEVQQRLLLSGSTLGITNDGVSTEPNDYSENEGYGSAW